MPANISSLAARLHASWRRIAVGCAVLAGIFLAASVALMWAPVPEPLQSGLAMDWQVGPFALRQLLPELAAALGLLAASLGLVVAPAAAPASAAGANLNEPSSAASAGLLAVVKELRMVLADEGSKVAAFREACSANTREMRIVSTRVSRLVEAALDAETRLSAGVDQADEALRKSSSGADSAAAGTQFVERALPEIAELIRKGIAEQNRATATTLDAAVASLVAAEDSSVQNFRAAVASAASQITALGDTAVALQRDVNALDTAGREIAIASGTVVSRLGGAVAHVDAALAQFPAAAAVMTAAAEQAVQTLAEASAALSADAATREASVAVVTAAAEQAYQTLAEASAALSADAAVRAASVAVVTATAEQANQTLAETAAALSADAAAREASVAVVNAVAERATQTLADASATLCADGAAMEALLSETRQTTEAFQRQAAGLSATTQGIADAARQAMATVAGTVETAAARLAALMADADDARQGLANQDSANLAELTTALEKVAITLVDGTSSLEAAGQRVAAAGDYAAGHLATNNDRTEAMLAALPDITADLAAAAADLRLETFVLTTAGQQMSAASAAATSAVTDVAVRAEISATSLDTAGHMMSAIGAEVASQIDRLEQAAHQAETKAALLPDIAAQIAATAARLQAVTESWPPESMLTVLPDAAARLEAATSGLDRLDALCWRLENAVAALSGEPAEDPALMTFTRMSADIGEAVRRVEVAVVDHEGVWPNLAAAMARVEAAAAAIAQVAAEQSAAPSPNSDPEIAPDSPPAALAATLSRLDEVSCQTELLLQQTEALAEAVIDGRAPGLPLLLTDRTPALLATIEAMTWRLRSVATALALVSDGVPRSQQRFA